MAKIAAMIILSTMSANTRTDTANVVNVQWYPNETISVIETSDGNIWEIGDELNPESTYTVTFNTNGTLDKTDDMVSSVKEVK